MWVVLDQQIKLRRMRTRFSDYSKSKNQSQIFMADFPNIHQMKLCNEPLKIISVKFAIPLNFIFYVCQIRVAHSSRRSNERLKQSSPNLLN